jgi:hypothetical protein
MPKMNNPKNLLHIYELFYQSILMSLLPSIGDLKDLDDLRHFETFRFRKVEEEKHEQDGQDDGEGHERKLVNL